MSEVSIEKCLEKIPNKFELSILAMNRAKEILLTKKSEVEETKYTKKSVTKAIKEIEEDKIDINKLKEKIKSYLLTNTNNLFSKDSDNLKQDNEELDSDDINIDDDIDEDISDDEESDDMDFEDIDDIDDQDITEDEDK